MAGPKASPTITGRGAESKPQPPAPSVTRKERSGLRKLFSRNKNSSSSITSASSSTSTLVAISAPTSASLYIVPIATPDTSPELDTAASATEAPIAELWNEAWGELQKNTALFEEYETRISASSSAIGLTGLGKTERAQVMKVLLEKKIDELESGQWKIGFRSNQFAVKDVVEPVVSVVDWAKEYIGKAAQASPYSSVAWAGVCLLLPLVLNPGEQEAARAKCLEGIAALLRQCSIREALYRKSYDGNTDKKEANLPVHISYRDELKILYVKILTFQAACLCHLSRRTGGRIVRDMVIWTDWDELSMAIDVQKERMGEIETQWRDFKLQEQWNVEEKRHNEHMASLNPISNEISRIREVTVKAQHDKIRLSLLEWLSSEDFSARYNDIWSRHEELTGNWLIENDRYNDWKKKPSSFLWLYGKVGSGKSYLSASAIHNLTESCEKSPYEALAYYYFSFNDRTDPDASRMLSSMIRQLCGARPDSPAWLNNLGSTFRDKGARPTLEHLESALWNSVEGFDAVYLIIDALDECTTSKGTRATLMRSLVKLQKHSPPNVHILVTSRQEPDIEAAFDRVPLGSGDKIDLLRFRDAVNNDIGVFIQQRLDSPEFDNVLEETKELAKTMLLEKADGMFQYVALQLIEIENSLCEDIPTLLANLPQGLDETYVRMLKSIDSKNYPIVYRILVWIATSEEPLDCKMIAEAAAIDPEADLPFDPSTRLKGLENSSVLLKLLPGLVLVGRTHYNTSIKFSHFSVQEFLFSTKLRNNPLKEVSRYALHRDQANYFIAKSCMCYHLYASQVRGITEESYLDLFPLWGYAARHWASHIEALNEKLWTHSPEKVLAALEPNSGSLLKTVQIHSDSLSDASHNFGDWRVLRAYSANPTYYLSANGYHRILSFYLKYLDARKRYFQINCLPPESPFSYNTPLQAAAWNGSKETVQLLLKHGADVNTQGGYYGNALQAAAYQGSEEIVELLLEQGPDINAQGGSYGNSLRAAAYSKSEKMVRLLLEKGADVNSRGGEFGTALQAAAFIESEEIVSLLLEQGANVNSQSRIYGTALQAAAYNKSENIVRLLLEHGADVNGQGREYSTAFQTAAYGESEEIVRFLLEHGADIKRQCGEYGTALQAAAFRGSEEIVRLLLEQGANVNSQCGEYGTALQVAAFIQSEKIVRLLLEQGANVNSQCGFYGTALQAAAFGKSEEIVRLLLEQGANVNSQCGEYGTALQAAACGKLEETVRLLLEHGADVNARGGRYGNALQAAARQGSKEMVRLLLEHGADVNAQGGKYGSALQAAAVHQGSEEAIELLLQHGADVNAQGGKYGNALEAAQEVDDDDIVALLLAHGATEQQEHTQDLSSSDDS